MAFDPDAYLAKKSSPKKISGFDPDEYLAGREAAVEEPIPPPPAEPSLWSRVADLAKTAGSTIYEAAQSGLDLAQRAGAYAAQNLLEGDVSVSPLAAVTGPDFTIPAWALGPLGPGLADIQARQMTGQAPGRINLTPRIADASSPTERLLVIRAAQAFPGMSLSIGSQAADEALAESPVAREAVSGLEDVLGETGAAAVQLGAQLPGSLLDVGMDVARQVPSIGGRVLRSALQGGVTGAEEGIFQAPRGERLAGGIQGGILGGILAGLGGLAPVRNPAQLSADAAERAVQSPLDVLPWRESTAVSDFTPRTEITAPRTEVAPKLAPTAVRPITEPEGMVAMSLDARKPGQLLDGRLVMELTPEQRVRYFDDVAGELMARIKEPEGEALPSVLDDSWQLARGETPPTRIDRPSEKPVIDYIKEGREQKFREAPTLVARKYEGGRSEIEAHEAYMNGLGWEETRTGGTPWWLLGIQDPYQRRLELEPTQFRWEKTTRNEPFEPFGAVNSNQIPLKDLIGGLKREMGLRLTDPSENKTELTRDAQAGKEGREQKFREMPTLIARKYEGGRSEIEAHEDYMKGLGWDTEINALGSRGHAPLESGLPSGVVLADVLEANPALAERLPSKILSQAEDLPLNKLPSEVLRTLYPGNQAAFGAHQQSVSPARADTQVADYYVDLAPKFGRLTAEAVTQPMGYPEAVGKLGLGPGGSWKGGPKTQAAFAASKMKAANAQMSGSPISPQPPAVWTPDMDEGVKLWRRWTRDAQVGIAKQLTLPEQRAAARRAFDVSSAIRSYESAQRMQDVQMGHLFKPLRKAANAAGPRAKKLLDRMIAQQLDPDRVLKRGEKRITEADLEAAGLSRWNDLWREGIRQNERYEVELAKANLFSVEQLKKMIALRQAGFAWLHRDYRRFLDGEFTPRNNILRRTLDWVQKHRKGMSRDQAAAYLYELMYSYGDGTPLSRFRQSRLNKEILKSRQDIPPILRDLMGEVHDGPFALASSMSEVERMWRQYQVTKAIVGDPALKGRVWDTAPNPELHPVRVWMDGVSEQENRRMYGELAGKWVAPELYEAVMEVPQPRQRNIALQMLSTAMQFFKFGKVGLSPVTWLRDFVGNTTSMAASGLPLWHTRAAGRVFQAVKAIADYGKTFTTPTGSQDARWLVWAYEDGALRPGLGAEFAGGSRARALAKEFLRSPRDGFMGLLDLMAAKARVGVAHIGEWRELADTVPRLAVYIEQVTKGVQTLKLDAQAARARASRIVNENFISAGNIGHGTRDVARFAGVMNPFLSWYADAVRVHHNWIRNAFSPTQGGFNSGLGRAQLFNVLMHYGMIAGLAKGLQYAFGLSDQEMAVAEGKLKKGYRDLNPFYVWLPGRDERGRPRAVSLNAVMPSATFFEGGKNPAMNLLANLISKPFQGGIAETSVDKSLSYFGITDEPYEGRPPVPGDEQRVAMESVWKFMSPGLLVQADDVSRRAQLHGQLRRYEEPLTTGQALSRFTPFPVEPVGWRSSEGERARLNALASRARQLQSQINRSTDIPKDKKQELRNRAREVLMEIRKEASQRGTLRR